MNRLLVKVCGNTTLEGALAAARAGADMLGFVFVPGVRRRVTVAQAQEMLSRLRETLGPQAPPAVGVFVDQPVPEVVSTVKACGLSYVQLCGEEDEAYCARMPVPVIRAVPVPPDIPPPEALKQLERRLEALARQGHLPLLDSPGQGRQRGGTGTPLDWSLAGELSRRGHRFLLAGGLTPDNVALAVRTVRPCGVDVSSGVERDGVKDPARVTAFIRRARQAL